MAKEWKPHSIDDLTNDAQQVYKVLKKEESDLGCVLIGSSYLAEMLATLLSSAFVEGDTSKKLLKPTGGALGEFMARSDLAYCLQHISKPDLLDFHSIAEMRNQFAHRHLQMTFADVWVREKCEALQAWKSMLGAELLKADSNMSEAERGKLARKQFMFAVAWLAAELEITTRSLATPKKARPPKTAM